MMKRVLSLLLLVACSKETASKAEAPRPSILLVTLDTTRADAMGTDTPAFSGLAKRGRLFRYAYATVPETLPSHASMMTGVYPAAHGVHENGRPLAATQPLLAERLHAAGYRTAAFVSGYPLDRRFGLARGFEMYDDELGAGRVERSAKETTDRALAYLQGVDGPLFLWVHYFDPHHPYEPTYRDEVIAMDRELGRLVQAFDRRGASAFVIAGDHGESLGEHGEAQHGNLLYEGAMRVPLAIAGPGVHPNSVIDAPVSTRRVFHTVLDWAGLGHELSLRWHTPEVVVGEAMKPFLSFGWQPQVMAVESRLKAIHAGQLEVYDIVADRAEIKNLAKEAALSRQTREALRDYPIPSLAAPKSQASLSDEERKQLASLGYVSSDARPLIRKDAPRPADMAHLFDDLDRASALFVAEHYESAIPLFEKIVNADPHNLMTILRLAASHSALGQNEKALAAFRRAEALAPNSSDVHQYLALHYVRSGEWERALPLLERVLAETPDRIPALEAMARVREKQGRAAEALALWKKIHALRKPAPIELIHAGELAMSLRDTAAALEAFEELRRIQGEQFRHDLQLGVLYLDQRRLEDARAALDRVPPASPDYAMALFKRAQVSVLLAEPNSAERIALARKHANATTRALIHNEQLFKN